MSDVHGNTMVTDEELLDTFDKIPGPFVTASEIANHVPIGRTAVNKRLQALYEDGRVCRKQPIPHFIGWWRCDRLETDAYCKLDSATD